jgi:hypothetical protein
MLGVLSYLTDKQFKQEFTMLTRHFTQTLSFTALASLMATSTAVFSEVVELSPNELNSAYIEDSTIYIPKSTRDKISQKAADVKVIPGGTDPDQIDRDAELSEGAQQALSVSGQNNQTWDATRLESSLANISQPQVDSSQFVLPPREIHGAPDGFELPENFSYTAQDLINMGFTGLSAVSDQGVYYGNNFAVGSDGTNGSLKITLPADYQSRIPAGGIQSDLLTITPDLQNAINMRLQLPNQ